MNIVIIGAGKIGEEMCQCLALEGHNITLIEKDTHRLEQLINMTDVTGVIGNGAMYKSQIEAGVDHCDLFIAVSMQDETNIIAAISAKIIGADNTIARVRDPEFSEQMDFVRDNLGITMMINPELASARNIARIIQFPSVLSVAQFDNGRVNMVEVKVSSTSQLVGMKLADLRKFGINVLVCAIERDNDIIIPIGDTIIRAADHIHVTGTFEELNKLYVAVKSYTGRLTSALIVGGGRITQYLIPRLLRQKMRLKVIEADPDKAESLAADYPDVEVVCGDGTDQSFLREERMTNYDAVIALTGIDEENLLLSIYAGHQGVKKTITKVNRTELLKVLNSTALDSIITPRRIIADSILRFVRALQNSQGSNVEALYRMLDNRVEALLFHVTRDSKVINVPLKDLKTRKGLLLGLIVRQGELIFPEGNDVILPDDRVVVVTTQHNFRDIDDILIKSDRPDFFTREKKQKQDRV